MRIGYLLGFFFCMGIQASRNICFLDCTAYLPTVRITEVVKP